LQSALDNIWLQNYLIWIWRGISRQIRYTWRS